MPEEKDDLKMEMANTADRENVAGLSETLGQDNASASTSRSGPASSASRNKFSIDIEDVLRYCFPKGYQHPFSGSRLIAFGTYGPLVDGHLRTGFKGSRKVMDYELEAMCLQIERDDIASIYLHRKRDLGMLTSFQQESIIAQADAHLKRAKGKAMLPRMSKQDIYDMFEDLPKDEFGHYSFHEMQEVVVGFRENRVKQYKRVFPELGAFEPEDPDNPPTLNGFTSRKGPATRRKPNARVSSQVAPQTMFRRNEGLSNADMISKTSKSLSKYAYQIQEIDHTGDSTPMVYNVRLLRDVEPKCKDPYVNKRTGENARSKWSKNTSFKLGDETSH